MLVRDRVLQGNVRHMVKWWWWGGGLCSNGGLKASKYQEHSESDSADFRGKLFVNTFL